MPLPPDIYFSRHSGRDKGGAEFHETVDAFTDLGDQPRQPLRLIAEEFSYGPLLSERREGDNEVHGMAHIELLLSSSILHSFDL
jgi:hypothetical protein